MAFESSYEAIAIARQALADRRIDDAILALQQANLRSPNSAVILSLMGAAYAQKNEYIHALSCFERAASTQPTAKAYYNIAALQKLRENTPLARMALERALRLDPQYEKAHQMLEELGPASPDSVQGPTMVAPSRTDDDPWDRSYLTSSTAADPSNGGPLIEPSQPTGGIVRRVASLMGGLGRRRAADAGHK